jgi:hypothetical protein
MERGKQTGGPVPMQTYIREEGVRGEIIPGEIGFSSRTNYRREVLNGRIGDGKFPISRY